MMIMTIIINRNAKTRIFITESQQNPNLKVYTNIQGDFN